MNQDTLEMMAGVARDNGLDAIVATSPENFAYIAGFVVPSHHVLRWRHAMLVVKPDRSVAHYETRTMSFMTKKGVVMQPRDHGTTQNLESQITERSH